MMPPDSKKKGAEKRSLGVLDYIRFDKGFGFFRLLEEGNDKKTKNTVDVFFHFDDIFRAGINPAALLSMKKMEVKFSFEFIKYPKK